MFIWTTQMIEINVDVGGWGGGWWCHRSEKVFFNYSKALLAQTTQTNDSVISIFWKLGGGGAASLRCTRLVLVWIYTEITEWLWPLPSHCGFISSITFTCGFSGHQSHLGLNTSASSVSLCLLVHGVSVCECEDGSVGSVGPGLRFLLSFCLFPCSLFQSGLCLIKVLIHFSRTEEGETASVFFYLFVLNILTKKNIFSRWFCFCGFGLILLTNNQTKNSGIWRRPTRRRRTSILETVCFILLCLLLFFYPDPISQGFRDSD